MKAKIALVDDHNLLRSGMATLLRQLNYNVVTEAANGLELIDRLRPDALPQLVLMDISMPKMDGYQTTLWLKQNHPTVKVLAISMVDEEASIIRMLRNGAGGYLLKESQPEELKRAIEAVLTTGFYNSDLVAGPLLQALHGADKEPDPATDTLVFSKKETEFLTLVCTELSYKEIAHEMKLSPRTVDHYRDKMHDKLQCKSRIGMVLYAIRRGLVTV